MVSHFVIDIDGDARMRIWLNKRISRLAIFDLFLWSVSAHELFSLCSTGNAPVSCSDFENSFQFILYTKIDSPLTLSDRFLHHCSFSHDLTFRRFDFAKLILKWFLSAVCLLLSVAFYLLIGSSSDSIRITPFLDARPTSGSPVFLSVYIRTQLVHSV